MMFTTYKEKIFNAVQVAERIVGKKESLPVLSCVYMVVKKDLSIQATNLESGVTIKVSGEPEEPGSVAVPAGILLQTLRSITAEKIKLSVEDGNLIVESRGSRTVIKAIPHEEFPKLDSVGGEKRFKISRNNLVEGIQSVIYATSRSMIRPELGSVLFSIKDKTLTFAATDSFRLAEKIIGGGIKGVAMDILIPLKHATEIQHVLDKSSVDEVDISIEDAHMTVSADDITYFSRTIDAQFPNYREIIPKSCSAEVTILKGEFLETLRKARVFSGADGHIGFHVYPKKKIFSATARSNEIGEMSDTLEAAVSGVDLDINFHIDYITECIQSIETDSVHLCFSGVGKPLVIKSAADANFTYLVMPLNR